MPEVTGRRALRAAGALTLLAVGTIGAIGAAEGSARAAGSYQATAAANGMRITMSSEAFPVEQSPIDVTAPMAQATSSSVDQQAFASYPYPGSLAAAAPGLIGGLAADGGHPLPFAVPGYPLVANARCSGDTHTVSVPDTEGAGLPGRLPYTMTSSCTPTTSESTASSGSSSVQGGVGLAVGYVGAVARTGQDQAGTTTAVGTSEATGVNVGGGLLQLSGINALASATIGPNGVFTPSSSFKLGTVSVAGTPTSFGPGGFSNAAGGATPVDVSAINSILRNAGIELTYISETRTKTSITSAGVQITLTQKDPQSGLPVITRYLFGQVTASAEAQSFDSATGTQNAPTGAVTAPGATGAPGTSGVDSAAVPGVGTLPSTGTLTGAPLDLTQPQASQVVQRSGISGSVLSFYLVLVLAGAALLGSSGLAAFARKVVPWTR